MNLSLRITFVLACIGALFSVAIGQDRIIKPEDKVRMLCEEEPSLTKDYTITKDGLIVLSFIGAVEVSGLTEKQAADKIAAKLIEQRILKKATITVTLQTPDLKGVRYSGAVKTSGEATPKDGLRLVDIVALAEPTVSADLERVEITTATGEKLVVNYKLFDGSNMLYNPAIRPGDSVFFPILMVQSDVIVLGGVGKPGSVVFRQGMKIREAIETAGGFVALAERTKVRIERTGADPQVLDLTLTTVDLELVGGDRIFVEIVTERQYVFVTGDVERAGMLPYSSGMTLSQVVKAAGPLASADLNKVTLTTKTTSKTYTYNVNQINQGYVGDVPVAPNDRITVSKRGSRKANPLAIAGGIVLLIFFISR